jgi:hypothetical protein
MIGGTQPARISQHLEQVRRGTRHNDGMIQRFGLMVWPDVSDVWKNVDRKPNLEARNSAFRRARAIHPHVNDVRRPSAMVHVPEVQAPVRRIFGGRYFRCRQRYGLVYASTREPSHRRAIDRAERLRKRVGGGRGAFDGENFPPKPPRMRWRTYRRLEQEYEWLQGRWTVGMMGFIQRLQRRCKRAV